MSDKFMKYLNEQIKSKDFDELLKGELNDSQIEMLKVLVNAVDDYSESMEKNFKNKDFQAVLSQLYEIHSSIDSGVRVMKKRGKQ